MLGSNRLQELEKYVQEHLNSMVFMAFEPDLQYDNRVCSAASPDELQDYIENNRKPTFKEVLFGLIDSKGVSDAEIYKRALIDRRHFSKIRSNPDYRIGKQTVVALALALELGHGQTQTLLNAAGYSLSDSETFDLVIQFCIEKKIYNIHDVNQALDFFSLKPLSGASE